MVPMPGDENAILPGLALAWASRSLTEPMVPAACAPSKQRRGCDHRDRHEVLVGIERHLRHQRGRRDEIAGGDQDRVAVGRRLGDGIGAERAARARAVLDHHRLAERLAELLPDQAGGHIGDAAGRERHDDADRAPGICLRLRGQEGQSEEGACHKQGERVLQRSPRSARRNDTPQFPMSGKCFRHRDAFDEAGETMNCRISRSRRRAPLAEIVAVIAVMAFGGASPARAQPAQNFYAGKQITLMCGAAVGGGYDALARLAARHLASTSPAIRHHRAEPAGRRQPGRRQPNLQHRRQGRHRSSR